MLPSDASSPFDDPAYLFEPWWPGTRVLAIIEEGSVRLQADELADVLRAFPELEVLPDQLAASDAIVEGTVLVLDAAARPDAKLLRRRLLEDGAARDGRAAFIATDLLRHAGHRLARRPFSARRARLESLVRSSDWCTVGRGYEGEGRALAAAAADLGFIALSAHRLDAPYVTGRAGDAWLRVPIAPGRAEADRLPPIVAVFRRLPLDGGS